MSTPDKYYPAPRLEDLKPGVRVELTCYRDDCAPLKRGGIIYGVVVGGEVLQQEDGSSFTMPLSINFDNTDPVMSLSVVQENIFKWNITIL